jgi:hypothetical protein
MAKIACWPTFQAAIDRKSGANTQPNHRAEAEFSGFQRTVRGCLRLGHEVVQERNWWNGTRQGAEA